MERAQKDAEIKFLNGCFTETQIALCADYRGLTVAQMTELRSDLRSNGAFGRVVKNTLAKLSFERTFKDADSTELGKFTAVFEGPSLLVFSNKDAVSPAKVLAKFAKTHQALEIKGGWFEGKCIDQAGVETLSSMLSREEVLAKLLNLMNAPATQLVRLMQAPSREIVQVLEAHRANLEKGE